MMAIKVMLPQVGPYEQGHRELNGDIEMAACLSTTIG
jgi:hypothetical protein